MKISILFNTKGDRFGGGFQFLKILKQYFLNKGVYENNPEQADVIIFNSFPFREEFRFTQAFKLKKKGKILIHRVDGPIYKARGRDFKVDKIIYKFNALCADGTVYQSNWSKTENQYVGMKKNSYETVIYNAADPNLFNSYNKSEFNKNNKNKLIATSSTTNKNKGFDIYAYLDKHLDFSKYEMTFIGFSPIKFKNINWIRPLDNENLTKILKQCDIFIHAGRNESCSNSLLEALSCGLVSIVINSGSHPELVGEPNLVFNGTEDILDKIESAIERYSYYQNRIKIENLDHIGKKYFDFAKIIYDDYISNKYQIKYIRKFHLLKIKILIILWNIEKFGIFNYFLIKVKNWTRSILHHTKFFTPQCYVENRNYRLEQLINKKEKNNFEWLFNLKTKIPYFLNQLKGKKRKGFYRYSFSGDYFNEKIKWGLGNTVFFLKIIYTLKLENKYRQEIKDAINYIRSFQKKNGTLNDPLVQIVSFPFRFIYALRALDFSNIRSQLNKRAESRQAFSALSLYKIKPLYEYKKIPKTTKKVEKYLTKLDWTTPWGAGSHFSHLLFFLQYSNLNNKKELIDFAINWVNRLQQEKDGFWYKGNPSIQQKINGAMKIITGLKAVNKVFFNFPEKVIDNCLSAINDSQACDNFNIVYVLKYCNEITKGNYRYSEIRDFMIKRLDIYKQYYHPNYGGFSFYKNRARDVYYNAYLSKGRNEPDIHGTIMFLWGISIIAQVLNLDEKLKFKEHIT